MSKRIPKYTKLEEDAILLAKDLASSCSRRLLEKRDEYGRVNPLYIISFADRGGYMAVAEDGSFVDFAGGLWLEMLDFDVDAVYDRPVRLYKWEIDGPPVLWYSMGPHTLEEEIYFATWRGGYRSQRTVQMWPICSPIDERYEKNEI